MDGTEVGRGQGQKKQDGLSIGRDFQRAFL